MVNKEIDSDSSAIWHLLIDAGCATEEQLEEIYDEHERTGKAFTTVLYNYGIIDENQLLGLIAESLGTDHVNIKSLDINPQILLKVQPSTARMYKILPVAEEDGTLLLAAADPMNYRMIDELHFVIGQECRIVVAKPVDIEECIEKYYPEDSESVSSVLHELEEVGAEEFDEDLLDENTIEEYASNAPIIRFVNVILYQAIKDRASDVHFEPFAEEFRIRYRIDGALYEIQPPPKHLAIPVISRIKVLSGLNITERRLPQDGRIELRIAGRPIDLRVSTLPTQYGESVVLRVLDRSVVNLDLTSLGIPDNMVDDIKDIIHQPNGIMVVTGPTGSGKTTTLYSCLKEVNSIGEKLLTTEDPVEYDLEGIMQVQVHESVGMTFAAGLRAFLRQDPDRIMVGEIRDLETAAMAIQASLTGHFVLSTLHTNDAPGAVTRLIDMGVEPFLISSTLVAALAQRLIRRVCTSCRTSYDPEDSELERMGLSREDIGNRKFYYGRGCDNCNNTGYRGRIGIFELLRLSPAIQEMINQRLPTNQIRNKAVEEGMRPMRESGIRTILDGVTTVEEVLKYT